MLGDAGRQRLRAQPVGRSMLGAIDELAEEEREVFGPVRIQGMTQAEAARVLGGSIIRVAPKRRAYTRHRGGAASTGARAQGRLDPTSSRREGTLMRPGQSLARPGSRRAK